MVKFLQHRIADRRILRLIGTYVFGAGTTQQVELTADLNMYANNKMYTHPPQLNWTRKGTMTRPLFHLGDRTFYPAGAPSVRIRPNDLRPNLMARKSWHDGTLEVWIGSYFSIPVREPDPISTIGHELFNYGL
jgi:hypothetical protein